MSQPILRREGDAGLTGTSSKEERCAESPPTFIRGKRQKNGFCGLQTLIVKGSRVVFTHEEGINTPRVRHRGRQPSIKCANMASKLRIFPFYVFMYFPFLCFLAFYGPFVFFIFLWLTRVFPSRLHILNCDEEIIPT